MKTHANDAGPEAGGVSSTPILSPSRSGARPAVPTFARFPKSPVIESYTSSTTYQKRRQKLVHRTTGQPHHPLSPHTHLTRRQDQTRPSDCPPPLDHCLVRLSILRNLLQICQVILLSIKMHCLASTHWQMLSSPLPLLDHLLPHHLAIRHVSRSSYPTSQMIPWSSVSISLL